MKTLKILLLMAWAPLVGLAQTPARDYTNAVLWQQYSGEYRALCFQAYNFAKLSLNEALQQVDSSKNNCVVVDVDETILDNSPFQGHEIKKGLIFNAEDWAEWTSLAKADTVPGALSFLTYAATKNVEIFYVTNRDKADKEGTLKNLQHFGFPNADEAHVWLKAETSDKEPRRQQILKEYHILLLCGDNLSDFANVFYREEKEVKTEVDKAQALFGTRYIVLPNPMYGDWEKQLYQNQPLKEKEKAKQRLQKLKTY